MEGTAYVNGSTAIVHVGEDNGHGDDETWRVDLIHGDRIVGGFGSILVEGSSKDDDGACREYYAASNDNVDGTLSVLVSSRDVHCPTQRGIGWTAAVVLGVLGGLIMTIGILYICRDVAMRWARTAASEEEALVL